MRVSSNPGDGSLVAHGDAGLLAECRAVKAQRGAGTSISDTEDDAAALPSGPDEQVTTEAEDQMVVEEEAVAEEYFHVPVATAMEDDFLCNIGSLGEIEEIDMHQNEDPYDNLESSSDSEDSK